MKKITNLIIVILVILLGVVPIGAEYSNFADDKLTVILSNNLLESDYALLSDKTLYSSELSSFKFDRQPTIKVYNEIFWSIYDSSISRIITTANETCLVVDYIVFDNDPVRLRTFNKDGKTVIGMYDSSPDECYITDIMQCTSSVQILGEICNVQNIYIFDGFTSHMGAVAYYCTNKGVFVKYYENKISTGVWFREKDFGNYATKYYNYLISPENNYNENGEPIGGGRISFLCFVEEKINNHSTQVPPITDNNEEEKIDMAFFIGSLIVIVAVAYLAICFVKKRQANKTKT